jgi:hypothetical protein
MTRHHLIVVLTILLMIIVGSVSGYATRPSAECVTDTECGCTDDCLDSEAK